MLNIIAVRKRSGLGMMSERRFLNGITRAVFAAVFRYAKTVACTERSGLMSLHSYKTQAETPG